MMRTFVLALAAVFIIGCRKTEEPAPPPPPATLMVTEHLAPLLQEEAEQFTSLYPDSPVRVFAVETREAIVHLLNDSVANIAIDRPLNDEERRIAEGAGKRIVENAFAKDALAVVVNAQNPASEISVESLRAIVEGAPSWNRIPESRWDRPVDLVLTGRNSGIAELIATKFFPGKKPLAMTTQASTQAEALAYVAATPHAITLASMYAARTLPAGTKILAVPAKEVVDGERVIKPTQTNLYRSLYPFEYSLYLYTAESKTPVGSGFGTFVIVTTLGQKIIQNAGLLPVNIPSRTIQLNAE